MFFTLGFGMYGSERSFYFSYRKQIAKKNKLETNAGQNCCSSNSWTTGSSAYQIREEHRHPALLCQQSQRSARFMTMWLHHTVAWLLDVQWHSLLDHVLKSLHCDVMALNFFTFILEIFFVRYLDKGYGSRISKTTGKGKETLVLVNEPWSGIM